MVSLTCMMVGWLLWVELVSWLDGLFNWYHGWICGLTDILVGWLVKLVLYFDGWFNLFYDWMVDLTGIMVGWLDKLL